MKQWLLEAGGWQQHAAIDSSYTLSVAPDAPVAVAMFRGIDSYYPVQSIATPPADIVNMMFGAVVRVRDEAYDTATDLNVDQAIAACEEACKGDKTRGTSPTVVMRVFRTLAVTMAQVRPIFFCPGMHGHHYGWCSPTIGMALGTLCWCMQTLPLIRQFWPGHFIFHAHPVLSLPLEHPDRQRLETWFTFQSHVCAEAAVFYAAQARRTGPSGMDPYLADTELLERGAKLGVLWDVDGKNVRILQDPFLYTALMQV